MAHNPYKAPTSAVQDPPAPARPSEVTRALQVLWAVTVIGLLTLHPSIRGTWWVVPDAAGGDALGLTVGIVVVALFLGIFVVLLFFMGRRHNWARWGLLIYVVITAILDAVDFRRALSETPMAAIIDAFLIVAELWALRLVFFGPGAEWFRWRADAA